MFTYDLIGLLLVAVSFVALLAAIVRNSWQMYLASAIFAALAIGLVAAETVP